MSAPDPAGDFPLDARGRPLLLIIDPAARRTDGESVRITRDVLCAGAEVKICLPDGPEEVARALARRGSRRPVVVGDDRALLHVVQVLQQRRELAEAALSVVPVGSAATVALVRSLGVPAGAVAASRTVLDGRARRLDLLLDDSGGVVLGGLRIPSGGGAGGYGGHEVYEPLGRPPGAPDHRAAPADARAVSADGVAGEAGGDGWAASGDGRWAGGTDTDGAPESAGDGLGEPPAAPGSGPHGQARPSGVPGVPGPEHHRAWWTPAARTARSALALLTGPVPGLGGTARRRAPRQPQRLRVEADGVLLADLDQPVERVSVSAPGAGLAEVVVHAPGAETPVRARARAVTVSGPDFRYRADTLVGGPVRTRTWTVLADAWSLLLPHG